MSEPTTKSGVLIGTCRAHLIEFMKARTEPIKRYALIAALEAEANERNIPLSAGSVTRRTAYNVVLTSEQQKRNIEADREWNLMWHEHANREDYNWGAK